jgi:hypothetical protein
MANYERDSEFRIQNLNHEWTPIDTNDERFGHIPPYYVVTTIKPFDASGASPYDYYVMNATKSRHGTLIR